MTTGRRPIRAGKTLVQVRLPDELAKRLQVASDERVVSSSVLVAKAVESYLDRLVPIEEMAR